MTTSRPVLICAFIAYGCVTTATTQAQTLGRLFMTPAQRAELEILRRAPPPTEPAPRMEPAVQPLTAVPGDMTINGLVLRSSGNNASWVNGASTLGSSATLGGVRLEVKRAQGGTVSVLPPDRLETLTAKPGQTVDFIRGEVIDGYESAGAPEETQ